MQAYARYFIFIALLGPSGFAADAGFTGLVPSGLCVSQCDNPDGCNEIPLETFPDFEITLTAIATNCEAAYLYAVEGACSDGKRILRTSSGYSSEARLYTAGGEFVGLLAQSDSMTPPCMGQRVWPEYLQCEAPIVVETLCGEGFNAGSRAFEDRWRE